MFCIEDEMDKVKLFVRVNDNEKSREVERVAVDEPDLSNEDVAEYE